MAECELQLHVADGRVERDVVNSRCELDVAYGMFKLGMAEFGLQLRMADGRLELGVADSRCEPDVTCGTFQLAVAEYRLQFHMADCAPALSSTEALEVLDRQL